MTTISISLYEKTKHDIDRLAKEAGKSRSDIIRETFARYRLKQTMHKIQAEAAPILTRLGLETEEDIAKYVKRH